MRSRSRRYLSGALAAWIFLSAAAHAQVNPFRRGPGLAPEDNQLLFESVARLNAAEPTQVGRSEAWSNPQTNSSGTSTVLRVFRSGGMACHLVRHHIIVAGQPPGHSVPPHMVPHAKRGMEDQGLTRRWTRLWRFRVHPTPVQQEGHEAGSPPGPFRPPRDASVV